MHSLDEAFKDLLPTNNTQEEIGAKIDAAIENLFSTSNTRTATFDAGAVYDEPSLLMLLLPPPPSMRFIANQTKRGKIMPPLQ